MSEVGEQQISMTESPQGTEFRGPPTFTRNEGGGLLIKRKPYCDIYEERVSWEVLTAEELRYAYVKLKLYQELGLPVPTAKLITTSSGLTLEVEDLRPFKRIEDLRDLKSRAKKPTLDQFYIASHFLNNPHFINLLAEKDGQGLILTDPYLGRRGKESTLLYRPSNPLQVGGEIWAYEQKYGLATEPSTEAVQDMVGKLECLPNRRIAEVVLEAGLPPAESRTFIAQLLTAKEATIRRFRRIDLSQALENTEEWDLLDGKLEDSLGNRPFHKLAASANRITGVIQNVGENLSALEDEVPDTNIHLDNRSSAGALDSRLNEVRFEFSDGHQLEHSSTELLNIQRNLFLVKRKLPAPIYNIRGYPKIEQMLRGRVVELRRAFREFRDSHYKQIWDRMKSISDSYSADYHDLIKYLCPSRGQLQALLDLVEIADQGELRDQIESATQGFTWRRASYKDICLSRSRALVAHLARPEQIRAALRCGCLQSSLMQEQQGKTVAVSSPAGQREPLPQLTFAIDGADLTYGAQKGVIPPERVVGFVAPYSAIVWGRKFVEVHNTTPSLSNKRFELHVFDAEHTDDAKRGIEINVDELILLVPENEQTEWAEFLKQPKGANGAGKDDKWVQEHLRTYPEYLDMDTYLSYLADRTDFHATSQSTGMFVPSGEALNIHMKEWGGYDRKRSFIWES